MSMPGDYMLDPPDDPPLVTCPECDGRGSFPCEDEGGFTFRETCGRCGGDGEDYLTDEEVRDRAEAAAEDRAEQRAEARGGW